jgi:SAM-dependent methyltransferase
MKATGKDIMQWDVRTWSRALDFWEKHYLPKTGGLALELGGREGGLTLYLASQGMKVLCSDIEDVSEKAAPLLRKYGVGDLVSFGVIDATEIPHENYFDVVVFKSIIGGIGRNEQKELQQKTFDSIYKSLKPGGHLLFAENLEGSFIHSFLRKKFVRWGSEWRYVNTSELHEFLKDFSTYEVMSTGFASAFGRSEAQRNLLSYADSLLFNHVVPKSWNYVAFGVAQK